MHPLRPRTGLCVAVDYGEGDMSYDVHVGNVDSYNYTYNVSKLFYDHMPADEDSDRGGLDTLEGLTGKQAAVKIAAALHRIERTRHELWQNNVPGEPRFCAKYDAPNGWGSALGAIMFLSLIMAACFQNPRCKVRIS